MPSQLKFAKETLISILSGFSIPEVPNVMYELPCVPLSEQLINNMGKIIIEIRNKKLHFNTSNTISTSNSSDSSINSFF